MGRGKGMAGWGMGRGRMGHGKGSGNSRGSGRGMQCGAAATVEAGATRGKDRDKEMQAAGAASAAGATTIYMFFSNLSFIPSWRSNENSAIERFTRKILRAIEANRIGREKWHELCSVLRIWSVSNYNPFVSFVYRVREETRVMLVPSDREGPLESGAVQVRKVNKESRQVQFLFIFHSRMLARYLYSLITLQLHTHIWPCECAAFKP